MAYAALSKHSSGKPPEVHGHSEGYHPTGLCSIHVYGLHKLLPLTDLSITTAGQ